MARRFRAAAQRRRRAASALVGADVVVGALVLDREAVLLEARARVGEATTGEGALASLASAIDAIESSKRAPLRRAFDALTASGPLALDRIAPESLASLRDDIDDLHAWLDGEVDERTLAQLSLTRALRLVALALAVALVARIGLGVLLTPPNRALHKPVVASSRFPDTPDPSGLTDGDRTSLGVHTTVEPTAWVTVDLGLTYNVRKIRIRNRTDCCVDEALPLIVEASVANDPSPFVAQRDTHFDVWEIDVGGRPASTIKVKAGKSPGYVALAELEVVGDR
ncbi:hypothetical protein BH09MYX1_BH09MYX1_38520 [soil metagenome]